MVTEPSSTGLPQYMLPTPVLMQGALLSKPFGHPEFSCSVFDTVYCFSVCMCRLAAVLIGSSVSSS